VSGFVFTDISYSSARPAAQPGKIKDKNRSQTPDIRIYNLQRFVKSMEAQFARGVQDKNLLLLERKMERPGGGVKD